MNCPNHPSKLISKSIGYCSDCIRTHGLPDTDIHAKLRAKEGLVPNIPTSGEIVCPDCGNHCRIPDGEIGYCHTRMSNNGKIESRYMDATQVMWYFDPLPTNCVADWVCPVSTSKRTDRRGKRLNNLAVFYGSCNSDCLFCQNTSYRKMMKSQSNSMTPSELADCADDRTACVCYFGGDPACNPYHSIRTSELLYNRYQTRVCYETNGNISGKWLKKISKIVQDSGGTIKFDLKAISPKLYQTLTGIRNELVLKNFRKLAEKGKEREGEFLVASILLIPGYIDTQEIQALCNFIVSCDSSIPTALLGFSPHHYMSDLPRTSRNHAADAYKTAIDTGLENVRLGNMGLLSNADYIFN